MKNKYKKITDLITLDILDFSFPYGQEYARVTLQKYYDRVIAFKITENYLFVLLKGKRKCFLYRLELENKWATRIKDKSIFYDLRGGCVIINKEEFYKFKNYLTKYFILQNLK